MTYFPISTILVPLSLHSRKRLHVVLSPVYFSSGGLEYCCSFQFSGVHPSFSYENLMGCLCCCRDLPTSSRVRAHLLFSPPKLCSRAKFVQACTVCGPKLNLNDCSWNISLSNFKETRFTQFRTFWILVSFRPVKSGAQAVAFIPSCQYPESPVPLPKKLFKLASTDERVINA